MKLKLSSFFQLLKSKENPALFLLFICYVAIGILIHPLGGYKGDVQCWNSWTRAISEHGLGQIYSHSDCNYLPAFLYVLKLFSLFHPHDGDFESTLIILKAIVFSFEAFVLYYIFKNTKKLPLYIIILLLLNPALWFNTMLFAQVDDLHTGFCVLSFFLLYKNKLTGAFLLFVLANLFKLQSIIFLPLFFILWFAKIIKSPPGNTLLTFLLTIAMVVVLALPFPWKDIVNVITTSVDYYPQVSLNAFNFWHLVAPKDPWVIQDTEIFMWGLNYKITGLILFCIFTIPVYFWFFFRPNWFRMMENMRHTSLRLIFHISAYTVLCFFLFFTQMHERYVHPAIYFGLAYAILSNRWIGFLCVSAAYILSLLSVMDFFTEEHATTSAWYKKITAILFFLGLGFWIWDMFRNKYGKSATTAEEQGQSEELYPMP